jgi:hypothetical protein
MHSLRGSVHVSGERTEPAFVRRVGFPLFNIDREGRTIESQKVGYVKGRQKHIGRVYEYRYWPSQPEKAEIKMMVAKDLQTGETAPWHYYGD